MAIVAAAAALAACVYVSTIKSGDWKDSVTFWTATARTAPRSAKAAVGLGTAYLETGEYGKALSALRRARRLDPDSPSVYSGLALYYLTFNDTDKAESVIREGLKRMPYDLGLHYHSGIVRYEKGDYAGAARIFAAVYAEKPGYLDVNIFLEATLKKLAGEMTPAQFESFMKSVGAGLNRK